MYDVRFINNVRVAQILFGTLTYAEIPLDQIHHYDDRLL